MILCMRLVYLLFLLFVSSVGMQAQDFSVSPLSDSLFVRMQGKSYPKGCTVARNDLRHVKVLHVDAQGTVHKGELVCNKAIAQDLVDIFRQLYQARYPIEKIRLIDDYEADDEQSMRDNNTSSFCYRTVSGTKKLSKHAMGMAIDINTRYNPWVRKGADGRQLISPSNGIPYADRRKSYPYKIVKGDLLYRLFIQHGFKWGGNWRSMKDYQHFEK
ncbi:MAG: M15 family metallopeptidase [Prevotella sp.]|nr:M15 family metallopeptidase [Prevotella sp.]